MLVFQSNHGRDFKIIVPAVMKTKRPFFFVAHLQLLWMHLQAFIAVRHPFFIVVSTNISKQS